MYVRAADAVELVCHRTIGTVKEKNCKHKHHGIPPISVFSRKDHKSYHDKVLGEAARRWYLMFAHCMIWLRTTVPTPRDITRHDINNSFSIHTSDAFSTSAKPIVP